MHPASQGLCRITSIEPGFSEGAKGYLCTNLSEKFPIFDPNVVSVAEHCMAHGWSVKLTIRKSIHSDYYVSAIHPVDFSQPTETCVNCGAVALRHDDGPRAAWYFECPSCHAMMHESVPTYETVKR